ncbi:MAG: UDP-N-acetylmuramoyl-L-alanyl-D-glutamate--2,6-diaminopimelate ligase [Candidatus Acidulodesulfobacterium acidiphilum]|uniref:UDP-N-acetylmuramoyl-L-alanyl-D-glutamate--2,6-diaminopimelate ligase n=1 Tax=Candidatus Acidulodesulfobacterium acidiphilum TaxID=2597224 RepID=A0A520XBQ2_9DELT|nr:MAG: UDP-N-acetylmuramoyl-L-alanyl-D-glutamate--2,6-diaminopimelate ligase [Candidatus Acidulodesulfobacterium acidiphilum]
MKIENIIKNNDFIEYISGRTDTDILCISNDSRKIKRGCLFAARKGVSVNSNIFAKDALSEGAVAVLTDDAETAEKLKNEKNITVIFAKDALKAYAVMSKNFFGNSGDKLNLIGVTGTNGKTTTTFLIKSILNAAGNKTGLIGTIDYEIGEDKKESKNTTPDVYELNEMFAETVRLGGSACVMEVSSHSLDQGRVYGTPFDAAVFTNLTRDHLDYHKDMESYYKAKKKLFSEVLTDSSKAKKYAIINGDDPYGKKLIDELKPLFALKSATDIDIITYGLNKGSNVSCENIDYSMDGLKFDAVIKMKGRNEKILKNIHSPLIGSYNLYNILAAVSVAHALSVPDKFIISGIESLLNVSGRLEKIDTGVPSSPLVCIDYAHTDDALKRVLGTLKDISKGKLISVFGCGGDRDKGKRPLMGRHSTDIADISIITSDNPRSEDPQAIIEEIKSGVTNASYVDKKDPDALINFKKSAEHERHAYTIEEDRSEAIKLALYIAGADDTVVIAGKGHEDYMIVKDAKFHFSDKEEVLKYYKNKKSKKNENTI